MRIAESQLVAQPPDQAGDQSFYRWTPFGSAAVIGIALAVLWNHRVADPIAMAIQRTIVGTTTPAELATAMALAFVAGAGMIVTA
jgi:hypothetical protein